MRENLNYGDYYSTYSEVKAREFTTYDVYLTLHRDESLTIRAL